MSPPGKGHWDRVRVAYQYLLPQKTISRLVHWLTRRKRPIWLKNAAIVSFVRMFGVTLSEAAQSKPTAYPTFNAFFTRALKPGARPMPADPAAIACPVDGRISQLGSIDQTRLFQAKGHHYTVQALLGGGTDQAIAFHGGRFATIYLSPRDYHRIHMPTAGRLTTTIQLPGRLFSVSPLTTRVVPGLFARNERVACLFETEVGPMAMVLVGAINVGSIETVWAGQLTPPYARVRSETRHPMDQENGAVALERGAEMGRFNMGSTVILLFGPDAIQWDAGLQPGDLVRLGQSVGSPIGPTI